MTPKFLHFSEYVASRLLNIFQFFSGTIRGFFLNFILQFTWIHLTSFSEVILSSLFMFYWLFYRLFKFYRRLFCNFLKLMKKNYLFIHNLGWSILQKSICFRWIKVVLNKIWYHTKWYMKIVAWPKAFTITRQQHSPLPVFHGNRWELLSKFSWDLDTLYH